MFKTFLKHVQKQFFPQNFEIFGGFGAFGFPWESKNPEKSEREGFRKSNKIDAEKVMNFHEKRYENEAKF